MTTPTFINSRLFLKQLKTRVEIIMKLLIYSFVLLQCILLFGCMNPSSSEPHRQIVKGSGTVEDYWNVRNGVDTYNFGQQGGIGPADFGFTVGDKVYFEAELIYSKGNAQGGTTYWCTIITMREG